MNFLRPVLLPIAERITNSNKIMKARQFNRLRKILKKWYYKEGKIRRLEIDALNANDEIWKEYHLKYGYANHHIRRMYLMYPDALFSSTGDSRAINSWLSN